MSPSEEVIYVFFLFFIYIKPCFLLDVCAYRQRSAGEAGLGPFPFQKLVFGARSSHPLVRDQALGPYKHQCIPLWQY
jgi:hypothetical protein